MTIALILLFIWLMLLPLLIIDGLGAGSSYSANPFCDDDDD
ncbi:MAG: hypothetical protein ACFBSE_17065 [Prochloraceae cyanobacterium]